MKDTLWGKCLSVFIALAFALSMISIVPAANAEGEETDTAALEMDNGTLPNGEDTLLAIDLDEEDDKQPADENNSGNDSEEPGIVDTDTAEDLDSAGNADADESQGPEGETDPLPQDDDGWVDFTGNVSLSKGSVVGDTTSRVVNGQIFSFCTSKFLEGNNISTSAKPALGTKAGVAMSDLVPGSYVSGDEKYIFMKAKVQTKSKGQLDSEHVNKRATDIGDTPSRLRYNAQLSNWEYLKEGTADQWVAFANDTVVIFYYSQQYSLDNDNKYEDHNTIQFATEDYGMDVEGKGYKKSSGKGLAVVQVYDMSGNPVGTPSPIYYYAACADKLACRFDVGSNWEVNAVGLLATKTSQKIHTTAVNIVSQGSTAADPYVTVPNSFSQLNLVADEDKNNFIIPFQSEHGNATHDENATESEHNNAFIIGVQIAPKTTGQELTVNYYDIDDRDVAQKTDDMKLAPSQGGVPKVFGTTKPSWNTYVSIDKNGKVSSDYMSGNLITINTDFMTETFNVELNPSNLKSGYVKSYAAAELDGNTLNLYFDRDVLGNDPDDLENTDYSDGIADKYQMLVTYGASGGTLSMKSANGTVVSGKTFFEHVVTLHDADGKPAVNGSYTLTAADVPAGTASKGFYGEDPVWIPSDDETGTPAGAVVNRDEDCNTHFVAYWGNGAINYYYDGELGGSSTNVKIGDSLVFDSNAAANISRDYKGHHYALDYVETSATKSTVEDGVYSVEVVKGDPGQNVIDVHYSLDEKGDNPNKPGDTDTPDATPDKYQATVLYVGVGGTIGGLTEYEHMVTLTKDGKWDENGTYVLDDTDVPQTKAGDEFVGNPLWSQGAPIETPVGAKIDKNGAVFFASWGNGYISLFFDEEPGESYLANVGAGEQIEFDVTLPSNKQVIHDGHRYALDYVVNNEATVIAGDPGQNVVEVHYALDEIGNPDNPNGPEDVDFPDGTPDKYQLLVSYAAVNGTLTGATKVVLDKVNADGNHVVDGTATLRAALIPTAAPLEGYGPDGTWNPQVPVDGLTFTDNADFVITYEATPTQPETPTPVDPDDPNPVIPADPTPGPTPGDGTTPGTTVPGGAAGTTPAGAPGAAAPGATFATIADDGTPLAAPDEIIEDEGNPLISFDHPECWTHWLMIMGMLVTVVYGLAVLYHRRRDTKDMDDFEDTITGRRRDVKTGIHASGTVTQTV